MRGLCFSATLAALVAALVSGCTTGGISATASYNPDYGPFDEDGNYVEAWADKPAKKHGWSRSSKPDPKPVDPKPRQVKEEFPLVASASRSRSTPPRTPSASPAPSQFPLVKYEPTRTVSAPRTVQSPPVRSAPTPPPVVVRTPPPPKPQPKPVSRPKPAPKPKPKPAPAVQHIVKQGDTLYSLSRSYGTSVSAIQKANGLGGTTIRLGQSLKIPK